MANERAKGFTANPIGPGGWGRLNILIPGLRRG